MCGQQHQQHMLAITKLLHYTSLQIYFSYWWVRHPAVGEIGWNKKQGFEPTHGLKINGLQLNLPPAEFLGINHNLRMDKLK